jgi:hypothetical protein
MTDSSSELLETVRKIHGLLELLAEDKIAERDAKYRSALLAIVGSSKGGQKAVLLMDGTRTQAEIQRAAPMDHSNLSKLVGKLHGANLVTSDVKGPKLAISIPANFFETNAKAK